MKWFTLSQITSIPCLYISCCFPNFLRSKCQPSQQINGIQHGFSNFFRFYWFYWNSAIVSMFLMSAKLFKLYCVLWTQSIRFAYTDGEKQRSAATKKSPRIAMCVSLCVRKYEVPFRIQLKHIKYNKRNKMCSLPSALLTCINYSRVTDDEMCESANWMMPMVLWRARAWAGSRAQRIS